MCDDPLRPSGARPPPRTAYSPPSGPWTRASPGAWPTLGGRHVVSEDASGGHVPRKPGWTRACLRAGQSANATRARRAPAGAEHPERRDRRGCCSRQVDEADGRRRVCAAAGRVARPEPAAAVRPGERGIPAAANPLPGLPVACGDARPDVESRGPPQFVAIPRELGAVKALPPGSPAWYRRIAAGERARVTAFACCARHLQPRLPRTSCGASSAD